MRKKILIVEDEFVVAHNLQLILTEAGYTTNGIAASVAEAQESIQKNKPDLVIVDIRLKGKLSGIDIARKLRADNIPFIYLSANANQTILEEAKTTEPYGFLVKPFRKKDLLVALEIAWYLHQHSFESKLKREEQLQNSLRKISDENVDVKQSLLMVSKIIQPHISFDFVACGLRPFDANDFTDAGYLRTGLNEYQFIGKQELMNMAGLTKTALANIVAKTVNEKMPGIRHSDPNKNAANPLLQKTVMDCLGMQSYLEFPFELGYGLSIHYFFYTQKADIYNEDHIVLLNRLKLYLEDIANKTFCIDTSSRNNATHHPVVENKKQNEAADNPGFDGIIGNHHLLLSALDLAVQVAPYTTSVLLLGESGTGKEKVAQSIHRLSPRKNGPFVKVNCAAIPPTLIESELFGHEKGAFTGATEKRKGKFELAHQGTIFLDEIGELPLAMQVKLLRVLQEREIEYVGGNSPVKVDVRIVTATNRNLEKEVAERNFRLDLYYRLNVFPITLPSLRERKTDIELLACYFAGRFCREFAKPLIGFSTAMISEMMEYNWPGNIRELENVVEQAVILNDGKSKLSLRQNLAPRSVERITRLHTEGPEGIKQIQMETERQYIVAALQKTNGRIRGINGAAELLKIKPTTLESKMVRLNINKDHYIGNSQSS